MTLTARSVLCFSRYRPAEYSLECMMTIVTALSSGSGLLVKMFAVFVAMQLSLVMVVSADDLSLSYTGGVREYCQLETFSARCRHGDVVAMTMARFGRMRVGRCIDTGSQSAALEKALQADPNSLGCYADVLEYADRTCSGKEACDILVPNHDLLSTRPCFTQLTMYFEASYQCVSVVKEDRSCVVRLTAGLRQHIRSSSENSGSSLQRARCGSRSHPWMLEAQTGQQVNISLLDFTGHDRRLDSHGLVSDDCSPAHVQYGYIVDKRNKKNVSICSSTAQQRHKYLYASSGSAVEIVLTSQNASSFLLSFEAVGCSNLVPPTDAWLRRTDNEATIGCYTTRQRWNLRCHGNQWTGTVGVCMDWESQVAESAALQEQLTGSEKSVFFQVIAIVTVATVGLAICLVIIFIGMGCARRYRIREPTTDFGKQRLLEDSYHTRKIQTMRNEFDDHATVHRSVLTQRRADDAPQKSTFAAVA